MQNINELNLNLRNKFSPVEFPPTSAQSVLRLRLGFSLKTESSGVCDKIVFEMHFPFEELCLSFCGSYNYICFSSV